MASLGEETRASCRGPSNHNAIALILPHKAMIGFDGGAIGADIYCDRTGIHARKVGDAAKILDALKDPEQGYYDPRDPFTTVPRSSVLASYAGHARSAGRRARSKACGSASFASRWSIRRARRPSSRSSMPRRRKSKRFSAVISARRWSNPAIRCGRPIPSIEQMKVDYRIALARLVPVFMPDLLFRVKGDGTPVFPDFAAAVVPTEFAPGKVFGTGRMQPIDYCVEMAEGRIAPPRNLDLATIQNQEMAMAFRFHISQYLTRRAADWKAKGFTETLNDWAALNARSKFWGDDQRAAFKNWEEVADPRNPHGSRQGVNERIMLRELLRRADMMVILENKLDALVRLHTPWPPGLIGHAYQYDIASNLRPESLSGPNAGLTEVLIPAGYVTTVYDPVYKLTPDGKRYVSQASDKPTTIPAPGLPFSLVFRCEPGKEDVLLKIASAYEAASQRRVPPPNFPPL